MEDVYVGGVIPFSEGHYRKGEHRGGAARKTSFYLQGGRFALIRKTPAGHWVLSSAASYKKTSSGENAHRGR